MPSHDQPTTPRLLMFTANSIAHAYGGNLYLADALCARGLRIHMLAHVPRDLVNQLPQRAYPIVNMPSLPLTDIPLVRGCVKSFAILREGLRPGTHWLVNDYSFYRQALLLKQLRPDRRLIHYTTEFLTTDDHPDLAIIRHYERHARVPDLVIDVEPHRAAERMHRFQLARAPLVLPNTLPLAAMPPPAPAGSLARLAGGPFPARKRILLYAGTAHPSLSFHRLAQALAQARDDIFFLGFIRGNERRLDEWRRMLAEAVGTDGGRICAAVPRTDLLAAMPEAHAGLIYYPPSDEPSVNQLFCAPTKLYEYIAAGLPVAASANPSLRDLLEAQGLGLCAREDNPEALADALRGVAALARAGDHGAHARRVFREALCFERTSAAVVDSILALVQTSAVA